MLTDLSFINTMKKRTYILTKMPLNLKRVNYTTAG